MSDTLDFWKKCNTCKKPIGFKAQYYICSVSTCTRKRTGFVFCSVSCWDAHLPIVRHRESWAEERKSPSREEWKKVVSGAAEDETFLRQKSAEETVEVPAEEPLPVRRPGTPDNTPKVILRRTQK